MTVGTPAGESGVQTSRDTGSAERAVFITIPLSHYCEKARWALDRAELPYREEPHAPLLHRFATARGGGRGTVPLLLHQSRAYVDSNAIVRHAEQAGRGAQLYPADAGLRAEADALQGRFDSELGPHARRWAYGHILTDKALLRRLWSEGVPRIEAALVPLMAPVTRRLVSRVYRISPERALRSLERVQQVFAEVDQRLSAGHAFLVGEQFSVADLTFAALAAPMLFPAECRAVLPALDEVPAAMRKEVARLRSTAAGEFVLRMYATQRSVRR